MSQFNLRPVGRLAIVVAALCSTSVYGQALEEVVVTAQKREQSLQDVPISVNAITGEKIEKAAIHNLFDMQQLTPNLFVSEQGINTNIFIRGIGSGNNQGFEQSAATFVDGIHHGRAQQSRQPFLDVERVEVLRGPQAILFGKNAIAGAMSVVSKMPTDEKEMSISGRYEFENEEFETIGIISGPLTDNFKARVAARYRNLDEGWVENTTRDEDWPQYENWTIRTTAVWDITPNLTASAKFEYGEFDADGRQFENEINTDSPAFNALLGPRQDHTVTSDAPEFSDNKTTEAFLRFDWDIGDHTLTSITAYSGYEFDELIEADFTPLFVLHVPFDEEFDQISQEIRLVSPTGGMFEYIVGMFYQHEELEHFDAAQLGPGLAALNPGLAAFASHSVDRWYEQETDDFSVFGSLTFNWERFHLTAGLRWSHIEKEGSRILQVNDLNGNPAAAPVVGGYQAIFKIVQEELAGERTENELVPMVNLSIDVTDDIMLYGLYSEGFKSGGFDARGSNTLEGPFEFGPEEAFNYEGGIKSRLFDGRVEFNLTYYHTDFENLQTGSFDGGIGFIIGNAEKARSKGIELESRAQVADWLQMRLSFATLDFEFEDFENGPCFFDETPTATILGATNGFLFNANFCDKTGNEGNYAPEFTGTLGADFNYMLPNGWELTSNVDFIFSDEFNAHPSYDPRGVQAGFIKVDWRVGVTGPGDKWEVALITKNLGDKKVYNFINNIPLTRSVGQFAGYDRFRQISLQARYSFF